MCPMTSYVGTFCSSWIGSHTCIQFHLDKFSHFKEDSWRFYFENNMADESCDRWHHQKHFWGPFYPKMTLKNFHTDQMQRRMYMQLWHQYESTYDVIKKITFPMRSTLLTMCQVSIFFLSAVSEIEIFRLSNMVATPRDIWRHNYQ